jgi:hypothetical protein
MLEDNYKYLSNEIITLIKESIKSRDKLREVITRLECELISNWAKINDRKR